MQNRNEASQVGAEDADLALIHSNGAKPMPQTNSRYRRDSKRSTATPSKDIVQFRELRQQTHAAVDANARNADAMGDALDCMITRICAKRVRSIADLAELAEVVIEARGYTADLKTQTRSHYLNERAVAKLISAVLKLAA